MKSHADPATTGDVKPEDGKQGQGDIHVYSPPIEMKQQPLEVKSQHRFIPDDTHYVPIALRFFNQKDTPDEKSEAPGSAVGLGMNHDGYPS